MKRLKEMKRLNKIAVLMRNYIPDNNAITYVINPTILELAKSNKIDIFCLGNFKKNNFKIVSKNINVIRINDNNWIIFFWKKLIYKLSNYDKNRMLNLRKYKNVVKKHFKKKKYDLLISTSFPFCLHELASELKNKYEFIWIAYQFDPYSLNQFINNKSMINHEINVLKSANYILVPKENFIENTNSALSSLKNKYKIVLYPIIDLHQEKNTNSDYLKIVYAGVFYENLREPFAPLKIIESINIKKEVNLHYICSDKLNNKIKEEINKIDYTINLYRNSPKIECNKAIINSSILLNIGNKASNQTPSKVFEYISYCKPILNFYYDDNDTSYKILKKYPLAINYKIGTEFKGDLNKKILKVINESINYEDLKKIFVDETTSYIDNAKFINDLLIVHNEGENI